MATVDKPQKLIEWENAIDMAADNLCELNPGFRRVMFWEGDWKFGYFMEDGESWREIFNPDYLYVAKRVEAELIDDRRFMLVRIVIDDLAPEPRFYPSFVSPNGYSEQAVAEIAGILLRNHGTPDR